MAQGGVQLHLRGINTVMRSSAVEQVIGHAARQIAAAAGPGFEARTDRSHRWVARGFIVTATPDARRAEARNKVLARALGARSRA